MMRLPKTCIAEAPLDAGALAGVLAEGATASQSNSNLMNRAGSVGSVEVVDANVAATLAAPAVASAGAKLPPSGVWYHAASTGWSTVYVNTSMQLPEAGPESNSANKR